MTDEILEESPKAVKFIDPYTNLQEDYSWLGLDRIPEEVPNVFLDRIFEQEQMDPAQELVWVMKNPDYLHFACRHLLNIEMLPFQLVVLETLWKYRMPMLIGTRGLSKSFILAVYCLLKMIFYPGCRIIICGAAFRQSKIVFDYMANIWEKAPILRDISGSGKMVGPKRDIDRCTTYVGDSTCISIPLGDGCLSPYTQMTYNNSFGIISEIIEEKNDDIPEINIIENSIWSHNGFVKSDESYYNGIKDTKIIKTSRGFSYEGTFNHKMKVLRNGEIQFVRSDEIIIGDRILIDRSYRWHDGKIDENLDECYALGLILGDGSFTTDYVIRYATEDNELIESLKKCNFSDKEWRPNDKYHYSVYGKQTVKNWLNKWGLQKTHTINKKLPKKVLSASREQMTACIQGLFDTDGGVQISTLKGGIAVSVTFWNTSEELVNQLQYILTHYGIISKKKSRSRGVENWNVEHSIQMTGMDAYNFYKEIGFRLTQKQILLQTAFKDKARINSTEDEVPDIKEDMIDFIKGIGKVPILMKSDGVSLANLKKKKKITRKSIQRFLDKYKDYECEFTQKLKKLANPNIYYDTVISIENGKSKTYDIHVPNTHEYCANGFFSHNTKIRGFRANVIIGEEFSSIPEEIFNLVVQGFGVVSSSPIEKVKEAAMVSKLKKMGQWTEELNDLRLSQATGNQIIYSGTAYWSFNHFARTWEKFHKIIASKGQDWSVFDGQPPPEGFNWKDYAILRIPYTAMPEGMLDAGIVATAKANLSISQFNMEFNAIFSGDSEGFFKRSIIEAATTNRPLTTSTGRRIQFSAMKHGEKDKAYVIGVDPAAMEDNAAIVILEMDTDHRKIVHCWTTNRKKFQNLKREMAKQGTILQNDYYGYIARKIREFMGSFNTERIVMDKNGGGIAVAEALKVVNPGEHCVYEIIDPEKPKHDDGEQGLHILELLAPTSDYNSESNHGMLKDLQDRVLMFPRFDTIEIEKAILQDKQTGTTYDTYEEICEEIEELKNEMTIINVTQSSALGKEVYDVPRVKSSGMEKGHLRKDRYSALLYANYYARNKNKQEAFKIEYVPVGGLKQDLIAHSVGQAGQMYVGPGTLKFAGKGQYRGPEGNIVVRH